MKRYIKDEIIKPRNQIVLHGTRIIKGRDGNEKEVQTQIINPKEEMLFADGWEEYVIPEPTEEEIANREKALEIRNAKTELANGDYKIIKCMEAYLCGEDLPYDITELHVERNILRDNINKYE